MLAEKMIHFGMRMKVCMEKAANMIHISPDENKVMKMEGGICEGGRGDQSWCL